MVQATPEQRALKMVRENRFLTLATAVGDEVWCAPVAYAIGPGSALHFYSAAESIHCRHILGNPQVAVSIYNSAARGEEVDGMQMSAVCAIVAQPELKTVSEHYFNSIFADPDERARWHRPPEAFAEGGIWRFFRIAPAAVYVIDADNFAATKIDRRTDVDLDVFLKGLKDGR